jgi:GT2 family glycosyltransferase
MTLDRVALVAIGRNEGERLVRCLDSVLAHVQLVVYVDSGSTDGSVAMARARGAEVVELDLAQPFTAARARNAGFERALQRLPQLRLVQFVDGDCEVRAGWLDHAVQFLDQHRGAAAVCGRRRERFPERSAYNRLCDMEWEKPVGPIAACGGDVMLRVQAVRQVGGYRDDLIAGEEPELCVRLRGCGWTIHCTGVEMTLHDAAMSRFGQWWRRVLRSGYAFAEGAALHGAPPERHWVHETRRAWLWGLALPLMAGLAVIAIGSWGAVLLAAYPLQVLRLYLKQPGTRKERRLKAWFQTLGRFPEALGVLQYWRDRLLRRRSGLIEYK